SVVKMVESASRMSPPRPPIGGIQTHERLAHERPEAAAEAMRRILINRARDRGALKRGGGRRRIDFDAITDPLATADADLLDLNEALEQLGRDFPQAAQVVHPLVGSIASAGRAAKGSVPPSRPPGFSLPSFSAASISFSSAASMTFSPGAPAHLWRMTPL